MAAPATSDDIAVRLGRTFSSTEEERIDALIDDTWAAIQAYTGQEFTLVEDDQVRLRARRGGVRLPQRPVVDVTAVANVDGVAIEFSWDSGDFVTITGLGTLVRFDVEPFRDREPWVDVTYSHGYSTVPAEVVGLLCQIVGRASGRTPDANAVTQESIAGYSYSVGSAAAQGPYGMLANERQVLDRYRRPIGVIQVYP